MIIYAKEPVCCSLHTDTCGIVDWCCDSCPEAGLVVASHKGKPLYPVPDPCPECGHTGWHFHADGAL